LKGEKKFCNEDTSKSNKSSIFRTEQQLLQSDEKDEDELKQEAVQIVEPAQVHE